MSQKGWTWKILYLIILSIVRRPSCVIHLKVPAKVLTLCATFADVVMPNMDMVPLSCLLICAKNVPQIMIFT